MRKLGILCGLEAEAKIARGIDGALVACAGAVPQQARKLARELIGQGADCLMSFGCAGALASELPVGALVVGEKVMSKNGAWACDAAWSAVLAAKIPGALHGGVWGSEFLVPTAAEKTGLHTQTGCAIVDMESQCAAEAAAEHKVPLAVVRVVCDTATHNVPPLVMAAINADGSTNYPVVLRGLLAKPADVFDLIQVGRSMNRAMAVLAQSAKFI